LKLSSHVSPFLKSGASADISGARGQRDRKI